MRYGRVSLVSRVIRFSWIDKIARLFESLTAFRIYSFIEVKIRICCKTHFAHVTR